MSWEIFLDGQNFGQPAEWLEDNYRAEWNDDFWAVSGSASMTFSGEAYDYIRERYEDNYCNTIATETKIDGTTRHRGLIFVSEATFTPQRHIVNVAISDNNYLAIIRNKRKQEYFVDVGKASDRSTITPATGVTIEFHDVASGASAGYKTCYRVGDVLGFLVRAMTNDTIDFVSDYFGSSGPLYNLMLVSGNQLSWESYTSFQAGFPISWQDLWADLKALFNLRGSVEEIAGVQTVRVEPYPYWRGELSSLRYYDLLDLTERVDADRIYATIQAGARSYSEAETTDPLTTYPNTNLVTWDEQTYNIIGDCVTENELDVSVSTLVIDSNSIEAALGGDRTKDEDVFLVETDGSSTLQYDILGDGNAYYNQNLNNIATLGRWNDRIHNSSVRDNGGNLGNFEASLSADTAIDIINSPDFDNVISDPDAAYNPAILNGLYTLPADGTYIFTATFYVRLTWTGLADATVAIDNYFIFNLFDYEVRSVTFGNPNQNDGDVSTVDYTWTQTFAGTGIVGNGAYLGNIWHTTPTATTGLWLEETKWGSSAVFNADAVPLLYQADVNMTADDYDTFLSDITRPIALNNNLGYVQSLEFKPFGLSSVTIESTKEQ